jgi:hypothetical protein
LLLVMVLKLFSNPFLLKAFGNGARSQLILMCIGGEILVSGN